MAGTAYLASTNEGKTDDDDEIDLGMETGRRPVRGCTPRVFVQNKRARRRNSTVLGEADIYEEFGRGYRSICVCFWEGVSGVGE